MKTQVQVHHPRNLQADQKGMPDRFIILPVGSTAAIWATLIMSREEPSGEVEEAVAGEPEEIVVEEDSTECNITFFSIVMSLIFLNLLLIGLPGMSL